MTSSSRPTTSSIPHQTTSPSERTPLLARTFTTATSFATVTLDDIDSRFKRWKEVVATKIGKGKGKAPETASLLISVFEPGSASSSREKSSRGRRGPEALVESELDISDDVAAVREAIEEGILPKMIQTGSSGSYFARSKDGMYKGVFKPSDEEPYGNLNPKRAFLRRYFWWAMGRPCLLAGFSAMSEAGASLLDDRLALGMVPKTKLVKLSSPSFHYHYKDRMAFEHHGQKLPDKIGSFQSFLQGYVMASSFLRQHPLPSRPRSVLERDLAAEQRAHRKTRKLYKARLRKCGVRLKYLLLCRQGLEDIQYNPQTEVTEEEIAQAEEGALEEDDFLWTPESLMAFRLELEKLVVFDYLCRNTDRGLDNFMIYHARGAGSNDIRLGAIDNSLAWPIKHPDGIRDYPYGWLYLPSDLIGGPFSQATKDIFLPLLSSPKWWYETEQALLDLFRQDEHFSIKLFESQMAIFKGQGWNILQCLRQDDEGPIELCARPKKVVRRSEQIIPESMVRTIRGVKLSLTPSPEESSGDFRKQTGAMCDISASSSGPVPAQAVTIKTGKGTIDTPNRASSATQSAHPRSLPETSAIVACSTPVPSDGPKAQNNPAYQSSLGIEVLENLNKAAKSSQRPALAKAVSGPDIFTTRAQKQRQSTDDRKYRQTQTRRQRGDLDPDRREVSKLRESDGEEDDEASSLAQVGMSSSDYFTYGVGRHRGTEETDMPSIDGALAAIGTTPTIRSSFADAGMLQQKLQRPSRRRARNWSVTSFGTRYRDDGLDRAEVDCEPLLAPASEERLIKVIVEKLVDDKSLAWQAWLRA